MSTTDKTIDNSKLSNKELADRLEGCISYLHVHGQMDLIDLIFVASKRLRGENNK